MPLAPGQTTLGDVRLFAQQLSDLVNSPQVDTDEWNTYIGSALYELYNKLISAYGNDYYVASPPYQFTTDGVNDHYALPTDLFKSMGVDLLLTAAPNGWRTLLPFNHGERNKWAFPGLSAAYPGNLKYRLNGQTIWLEPFPAAGLTLRILYIPRLTLPTADDGVIDGVSGFEKYVAIEAAIMAKTKLDLDITNLAAARARMDQEIQDIAENRDVGSPATVVDVTSRRHVYGFSSDWGE